MAQLLDRIDCPADGIAAACRAMVAGRAARGAA
jgi:hypothetical protein